jgi:uncharacterized protein
MTFIYMTGIPVECARKVFMDFSHPIVAMHNAEKYFDLDNKVLNIIESHMFPLTITHVPKSKEAIIVCFVDKYCAIREMMHKKVC